MTKQKLYLLFSIPIIFFSCTLNQSVPSTDIEAASQFVQDIWHSDFKKAEELLLKDEVNNQIFDRFEEHFKTRPKEELEKYKNASIILNDVKPLNDSVSIINYSNSFNKAEKTDLKLIRKNGQWLIDLKYTIPHADTKD